MEMYPRAEGEITLIVSGIVLPSPEGITRSIACIGYCCREELMEKSGRDLMLFLMLS